VKEDEDEDFESIDEESRDVSVPSVPYIPSVPKKT
jgi:hypothetical protein